MGCVNSAHNHLSNLFGDEDPAKEFGMKEYRESRV